MNLPFKNIRPYHTSGATQVFLLFQPDEVLSLTSCTALFKQQMHLHPLMRSSACWSETEVCSGALLARCYFEELKINCATDQLQPGLKSMAQYFFIYLKSVLVENAPLGGSHNVRSFCLLHTGMHTNMPNITN